MLVLPPTGMLLIALIGLWIGRRRPRLGCSITGFGVLGLLLLSVPVVAGALLRTLQPPSPFSLDSARQADAIVILGGGARPMAPEYGADTLASLSLERVRYGARIARMTGLPVLVSGGAPKGMTPEALLMRQALQEEFNVPVRWTETDSLNTHENAVRSASILHASGIRKVVVVTHAFDMLRASAELQSAGIETVPAAVSLPRVHETDVLEWLPGISGLQLSHYVLYEILANLRRSVLPDGNP